MIRLHHKGWRWIWISSLAKLALVLLFFPTLNNPLVLKQILSHWPICCIYFCCVLLQLFFLLRVFLLSFKRDFCAFKIVTLDHALDPVLLLAVDNHGKPKKRHFCECGRSYSRPDNLVRHQRLECGKEPQFHCTECDEKFRRRSKLRDHCKSKHQIDL